MSLVALAGFVLAVVIRPALVRTALVRGARLRIARVRPVGVAVVRAAFLGVAHAPLVWAALIIAAGPGAPAAHAAMPAHASQRATSRTQVSAAERSGGRRAESPDVVEARALFRRNLDAIRHHDRAAYLACYWHSEQLARTGPTGPTSGFDALARSVADNQWPDVFEASDLRVTPVRDGLVYGTYRYRVR